MKISHNWLQTYFDKPIPAPEKLADLLTFGVFEMEGMEKIETSAAADGQADTMLDVKVLPDRAHYALCHRGMASEVAALANMQMNVQAAPVVNETSLKKVLIQNEAPKLCRRYIGRCVEGVSVKVSPAWLKARLETIGQRSINTVVDATNFVMFDIGQPLHAFDADKVKGGIVVRLAKAGEKISTLDGGANPSRDIELSPEMLVIADEEGPLAIAGVKGGKRAAVDESTKNIILESAFFDPVSVRKTSAKVGIRNESSRRFENEITPHLALEAMNQVTALIIELSEGNAKAGQAMDVCDSLPEQTRLEVSVSKISEMLGVDISAAVMSELLSRLNIKVFEKGDTLFLEIPHNRIDLRIPADIAEEVGRLYGYDKIPSQIPAKAGLHSVNKVFYYSEKCKNILLGLGFSEVHGYALVAKGHYEVAYPLASDKGALRTDLSLGMMKALEMNGRNAELLGLDVVRIFEVGAVFNKDKESLMLCIGALQAKKVKGKKSEDYVKTAIEALEAAFGVRLEAKIALSPNAAGQSAFAEVNLESLIEKLPTPASYADLAFVPAVKLTYKPFSIYPFIVRDIAMFVPSGTAESMVQKKLFTFLGEGGKALVVKGPDCFDRFEKDGKLSLAFRMVFQSYEKTLSSDEVDGYMTTLTEKVKAEGWEVR